MDDSISFDKKGLMELSNSVTREKIKMVDFLIRIEANLNAISNNWTGPIRDSANSDFINAKTAMAGMKDNLKTISKVIGDKASAFEEVSYK